MSPILSNDGHGEETHYPRADDMTVGLCGSDGGLFTNDQNHVTCIECLCVLEQGDEPPQTTRPPRL